MPLTDAAARTVAALVNRPVAEIMALNDSATIYRNVITGYSIKIGRIFKDNVLLTLQEMAAQHRASSVEIKVNPAGQVSMLTGSYNSQGFTTLAEIILGLEKRAGHHLRSPLRYLQAARQVCQQAELTLANVSV